MEVHALQNQLSAGETLWFGERGSKLVLGQGWSGPEPEFCWTDGVLGEVLFILPPTATPLTLIVDAEPKIRGGEATRVLFCINGQIVSNEMMTCRSAITLPIEANSTVVNLNVIVPSALTAANLMADPADYRHLGLCVWSVTLENSQGRP